MSVRKKQFTGVIRVTVDIEVEVTADSFAEAEEKLKLIKRSELVESGYDIADWPTEHTVEWITRSSR